MTKEEFEKFKQGKAVVQLTFDELSSIIVSTYNNDPDQYINDWLFSDMYEMKIIEKSPQREFANINTSQDVGMPCNKIPERTTIVSVLKLP